MKVLFLILLFPRILTAQGCVGVSAFAAMHPSFPCQETLNMLRRVKSPCMAVLWGTFGRTHHCTSRFRRKYPDAPLFIHLSNEVCRKHNRCHRGELFKRFSVRQYNRYLEKRPHRVHKRIVRRVERIKKTITPPVFLSLGLEDNYSPRAAQNLYNIVKEVWEYEIYQNPAGSRCRRTPRLLCEIHAPTPQTRTGAYSNDGTDVRVGREECTGYKPCIAGKEIVRAIRKDKRSANYLFLWIASLQGLRNDSCFIKPRSRHFGIFYKDVDRVNKLLRRIENVKILAAKI